MSQWTSPGRIVTGLVGVTAIVAALASATGSQRAQSLGLTRHGQTLTAQDAGAADAVAVVAINPGTAGQVYTISDAGLPHWAAVPSSNSGLTITTYYADSFTAVAGSESASISGTGSTSSITLGATSTARAYGTSGVTAARALLTLPSGARGAWVELQQTGTGSSTAGNRFVCVAVQNVASGVPTALWGFSVSDATATSYAGSLLSGPNTGGNWSTSNALAAAADRWMRVSMGFDTPQLTVLFGTGSAGARPTTWTPPGSVHALASGYAPIPDTGGSLYLVIYYVSTGGGAGTSVTLRATVRVTT